MPLTTPPPRPYSSYHPHSQPHCSSPAPHPSQIESVQNKVLAAMHSNPSQPRPTWAEHLTAPSAPSRGSGRGRGRGRGGWHSVATTTSSRQAGGWGPLGGGGGPESGSGRATVGTGGAGGRAGGTGSGWDLDEGLVSFGVEKEQGREEREDGGWGGGGGEERVLNGPVHIVSGDDRGWGDVPIPASHATTSFHPDENPWEDNTPSELEIRIRKWINSSLPVAFNREHEVESLSSGLVEDKGQQDEREDGGWGV